MIWKGRNQLILPLIVSAFKPTTSRSLNKKSVGCSLNPSSLIPNRAETCCNWETETHRPSYLSTAFSFLRLWGPSGYLSYVSFWHKSSLNRTLPSRSASYSLLRAHRQRISRFRAIRISFWPPRSVGHPPRKKTGKRDC